MGSPARDFAEHARTGACEHCRAHPESRSGTRACREGSSCDDPSASREDDDELPDRSQPSCAAHGMCAELLPERISLDEWGYPVLDDQPLDPGLLVHARRAAAACPTLALLVGNNSL
jgi:ferredoxin